MLLVGGSKSDARADRVPAGASLLPVAVARPGLRRAAARDYPLVRSLAALALIVRFSSHGPSARV
jgi:hypothetical protein